MREEAAYSRYLTVFDREVEFHPTSDARGRDGDPPIRIRYDVVGHPRSAFQFAVVFPFHPATDGRPAEVTLVREYIQATNARGVSLPTGSLDPKRHRDLSEAAAAELAEEARLEGGELIPLMNDPEHPGFVESKWCANRFKPFLCVGPAACAAAPPRDPEEFSIVVDRVSVPELRRLMWGGDMMQPSIVTAQMALDYLERRGMIGGDGEVA